MANNNNSENQLYQTLGALLESNKDLKEELKFIHKALLIDREKTTQELKLIEKRLSDVEKKQYTIVTVATVVWGCIVMLIRKYL